MIRIGHRDVAIVAGPPWLWTSQQRLAGYREALAGAGKDPDDIVVIAGDYTEDAGFQATRIDAATASQKGSFDVRAA